MNSYEILIKLFDKFEISEIERFEIYEIIKSEEEVLWTD